MSDEKILLPPFLIAELYKGSLVNVSTSLPKEIAPKAEKLPAQNETIMPELVTIKFSGGNQKKVVIVVNEPYEPFLKEDDLTFLTTILKACNLTLTDIAIINMAKQKVSYKEINDQLGADTVLLFDADPSAIQLPFLIPAFQLQKFNGSTIMVAPALTHINKATKEGKLLKTKLWLSLKQVFNI